MRGDARYAIELLWRAGKYAEAQESSYVYPEHVRTAVASIYAPIKKENLAYLSRDKKIILLALCRVLIGERESADVQAYSSSSC